jgi:hypothetical protein
MSNGRLFAWEILMIERLVFGLCVVGLGGLGVAGTLAAQRAVPDARRPVDCSQVPPAKKSDGELIQDFDALVQARFRNFDDLGVTRVMTRQHRGFEPVFTPERRDEVIAICNFGACGRDAAIYIAGRGVLGYAGPREYSDRSIPRAGRGISVPVHVAGSYAPAELPPEDRLIALAKAVFTSGNAGASGSAGEWTLEGRPIIARSQSCADCHNGRNGRPVLQPERYPDAPTLRVGDAVGAALYAVRTRNP